MTDLPGNENPTESAALTSNELISRLREAEATLEAIRAGGVDAGAAGHQVYTLENADRPYRVFVEQRQEGAVTFSENGTILYCNKRFATLVSSPHDSIIGLPLVPFFSAEEGKNLAHIIEASAGAGVSGEFTLVDRLGSDVPVNISLIDLKVDEGMPRLVCGIVTDLTFSRMRTRELAAPTERLG